MKEGPRTSFEALCDVLGIELTTGRWVLPAAMPATELVRMRAALRAVRRWPS